MVPFDCHGTTYNDRVTARPKGLGGDPVVVCVGLGYFSFNEGSCCISKGKGWFLTTNHLYKCNSRGHHA